jgi:ABC-type polysaccharide/polyol phosphate transport system ATPase subunit
MSDTVIKVEGLGKKFIIGHQSGEQYTALRDVITNNARSFFRKTRDIFTGDVSVDGDVKEDFWALKEIDFGIKRGDRVGIIGRNGAGKSTLLKLLSRITEPTTGRITIQGRVASLLEVGTGFHPELTGRENVFLNGAILGMSRSEIKRKFDEIVAFAEIETFLDTPVKRYSSGMYVRLAFAVAAHLEPEILIIDEVLAVGDSQFQKKCINKMEDVSRNEGRTILFVSHNMIAIQKLCNDVIVLNKGNLLFHGERARGMMLYEQLNRQLVQNQHTGDTVINFKIEVNGKTNPESLSSNDSVKFVVEINSNKHYGQSWVNICIDSNDFSPVAYMRNDWYDLDIEITSGRTVIEIVADDISLASGIYNLWTRVVLSEEMKIIDSNTLPVEIRGKHVIGHMAHKNVTWTVNKKVG